MTSVTTLAELVDVVIGVDTHVETHSACAIRSDTGAVIDQITVPTTPVGYQQLVEFADALCVELAARPCDSARQGEQPGPSNDTGLDGLDSAVVAPRAWAIEGTGGHGAGLTRVLDRGGEVIFEMDRPQRAKRRNGKKSDPLDAERAAREALARPRLGTPRAGTGDRQVLSVLLSARAGAVQAAADAQRQLFSHVVAAPEQIRERLRGLRRLALLHKAAKLRGHPSWDAETRLIAQTLSTLAKRALALVQEADAHRKQIGRLVRSWRPDLLQRSASARSWPLPCCAPGPTRAGSIPRPLSPCSPAPPRSPPTAARSPPTTDSTATATDNSTAPCTPSPSPGNAATNPPRPTPPDAPQKARPNARSAAASSATSSATSTDSSSTHQSLEKGLTKHMTSRGCAAGGIRRTRSVAQQGPGHHRHADCRQGPCEQVHLRAAQDHRGHEVQRL